MFKKISATIPFPVWAEEGTRWRKLEIYDRLLDGTFYDHLPYAFYDEQEPGTDRYIPLAKRRPSCQYRIPRYVARWAARKLFAGRHIPKIRAKDKATEEQINKLLTGTRIWPTMFEAAYRGTVGSVAVTFRVDGEKIGLKVWRSVWCSPQFDDFGELTLLRVHYVVDASQLSVIGLSGEANRKYWFIRDYGVKEEITYTPVLENDWNPVSGFKTPGQELVPHTIIEHNLGFVPGIWIMNPAGMLPDGAALWEDAIPDNIEVDYLMSQASRGSRYSCAPQLVTKGEMVGGGDGGNGINPTTLLAFRSDHKDPDGNTIGGGDAKLLEMSGSGVEAALKIVSELKKMAMEQTGVVQKDTSVAPKRPQFDGPAGV